MPEVLATQTVPLATGDHGVAAFEAGATAEEIAQQYPTVSLAAAYQVIGYSAPQRTRSLPRRAFRATFGNPGPERVTLAFGRLAGLLARPPMSDHYDFREGQRCRVVAEPPMEPGKVKITIRLDEDLVNYFGGTADSSGGKASYQTLINAALLEYVEDKARKIEDTQRRI